MFPMRRLDIYLNDHLAGSMLGVELASRALEENRGTPLGCFLERLHGEIAEDRQTLMSIMERLAVDRSPAKPALAWAFEKVGRLKSNGQFRGYSPLSPLVELEGLETGVSGKRSLWQALQKGLPEDGRLEGIDFDGLIRRADEQLSGIQEQRLRCAREALVERA
jgi:hypothetical protein